MVGSRNLLAIGLGIVWLAIAASALAADEPKPAKLDGTVTLSQGEWARMLVTKLGANTALRENAAVDDFTGLLGARGLSLSRDAKAAKPITSDGNQRAWRYDFDVPRTATWLVTVKNAQPVFASVDKSKSKLLPAGGADGMSDVGAFPLQSGPHSVTITANGIATAPDITAVAGCHAVLPAGGWQSSAKLTYGNLGRTLVQAMRQNGRLPAAEGLGVVAASSSKINVDVPSEGTYTLLLGGKALERASYRLGGCEETTPGGSTADGWREGSTALLAAGAQTLELSGVDAKKSDGRVRLVRRVSADAEYLAVLQSMGVKLPVEGKTTAAIDERAGGERVGLVARANGSATAGLASLASRTVTREEAERILNTPGVAKLLANGMGFPKVEKSKPKPKSDDIEAGGTLEEPVTGTLNQAQEPDPQ